VPLPPLLDEGLGEVGLHAVADEVPDDPPGLPAAAVVIPPTAVLLPGHVLHPLPSPPQCGDKVKPPPLSSESA